MRKHIMGAVVCAAIATGATFTPGVSHAKDLGDILLKKGLITEEELKQAREEDKQKSAAEESRRDAIAAKLPKWLDMISPFGDIRTRVEGFYAEDLHARTRYRLRARVGLNINPSDEIGGTFRIASGNPNDPISTNQDFNNLFTNKSINLDQAYLTVKPGKTIGIEPGWVTLVMGKFPITNTYRVSEMVWDDDLEPEGATELLNLIEHREGFLRGLRLSTYQWVADENKLNGEPWMAGGQLVSDMAFSDSAKWSVAFADYSWQDMNKVARKFLSPTSPNPNDPTKPLSNPSFNSSLANNNRVRKDANKNIIGYQSGFNLVDFINEVNFSDPFRIGVPAGFFNEVVYNTEADGRNVGVALGVGIGKVNKDWYHLSLKNAGDWGASYDWTWVEQDAALSLFSYSDGDYVQQKATQKSDANSIANIVRLDYMLFSNFQLTAKVHFINALDRDKSNVTLHGNATFVRPQLDAMLKF